jgi:hypothetical protein
MDMAEEKQRWAAALGRAMFITLHCPLHSVSINDKETSHRELFTNVPIV